jgi:hypothetical protein
MQSHEFASQKFNSTWAGLRHAGFGPKIGADEQQRKIKECQTRKNVSIFVRPDVRVCQGKPTSD